MVPPKRIGLGCGLRSPLPMWPTRSVPAVMGLLVSVVARLAKAGVSRSRTGGLVRSPLLSTVDTCDNSP